MTDVKTILKQVRDVMSTLGPVIALISTVVALYITSRLAPFAEDISELTVQVKADEARITAVETDHNELVRQHNIQQASLSEIPVIKQQITDIDKKIDKIGNKLDTLFVPR